jgi:hypothetical protein
VRNRAISLTDPRGLDYWIEGPNPAEPAGHQSVCVGDPLGNYRCFSFGVNGSCCLQGEVYEDDKPGGPILPGAYRKTNGAEDYAILNILAKQLGTKGHILRGTRVATSQYRTSWLLRAPGSVFPQYLPIVHCLQAVRPLTLHFLHQR